MKINFLYSLRYRIAITILLLELMMITVVLWFTLSFSEVQSKSQMAKTETVTLGLLADLSSVALFTGQYDEVQGYVNKIVMDPHIMKIHVTDGENLIVISSDFDEIGKHQKKLKDHDSVFWRTKKLYHLGQIAIQFSNDQLAVATSQARKFGTTIALVCISIIALVGLIIGYWLTRRLSILTKAAQNFEKGDSSVEIEFRGQDEIAVLGNTFRQMRQKIDSYIEQLEVERTELKQSKDMLEQRVSERTAELSELNKQLQLLSERDELTQVYNRRKFNQIIALECAAASRHNSPLSIAVIDIDYFKAYNDNYGHQKADRVLVSVAKQLKSTLKRPNDAIARYGGEEFVAVMPATDLDGATILAEAMRTSIEAQFIQHDFSSISRHLTVSIGVAVFDADCRLAPNRVFACADEALYEAKNLGRNRVYVVHYQANKPSTVRKLKSTEPQP